LIGNAEKTTGTPEKTEEKKKPTAAKLLFNGKRGNILLLKIKYENLVQ